MSAFKTAFDEVANNNQNYSLGARIYAACELLVKRLKVSRSPDENNRQTVHSPDKKLIGFIKNKTTNSPALARGVRYAYGYTTYSEFIAFSANGKEVARAKLKKDALFDLVRDAYQNDINEITSKKESVVRASDQIIRSFIKETIKNQTTDIRHKNLVKMRGDGALRQLVVDVHDMAATYHCTFEDVLNVMLDMKDFYLPRNEDD